MLVCMQPPSCPGERKLCKLCREPDQAEAQCALAPLQFQQWHNPHSGVSAGSRETCFQTRDSGAHLLIMEQGALCLPRHMQVPTCVCHLQAQRPSGERLRGNTCRLIVQDVRADPTCRQGQPREPPTLRSQDADMQLCTGHHCHSFSC